MTELPGLVQIGVVHSPLREPGDAPRQGRDAGSEAEVEIWPPFAAGLQGIEARGRLLLVCWLHRAPRDRLQAPPRQPGEAARGVFASRSPWRPNPIAVYPVELLTVVGNRLRVRGIDALDGTPVVDLKPLVPRLDD